MTIRAVGISAMQEAFRLAFALVINAKRPNSYPSLRIRTSLPNWRIAAFCN